MISRNLLLSSARCMSTSSVLGRPTDLISDAYLKHIRDFSAKQKAAGGDIFASSPEFKKELDDQLTRLAKKFELDSTAAVTKLDIKFEKPTVESSVAAFSESGQSVDQLISELKQSKQQYDAEQAEKKRKAQETAALMGQEEEFMPFAMPLKETKAPQKQQQALPATNKNPAIA